WRKTRFRLVTLMRRKIGSLVNWVQSGIISFDLSEPTKTRVFLYRTIDIAQATVPARIGDLATALTSFDSLSDYLGNVCPSLKANIFPNGLSIEVKTITERYRVFVFLDPHTNPKLIFSDHLFCRRRYIDNIAAW